MPIEFREEVVHEGRKGIAVLTFSLTTVKDFDDDETAMELYKAGKFMSFAEQMRRESNKSYIRFPNSYSGIMHTVTFEEIMREYEGLDFENAFLSINTAFWPNKA